uniref:Uncharacterized protein n=1 Tax=Heterosigma akashiwo TaxID=2829 RepID=A0A6V1Q5I9_HETAK
MYCSPSLPACSTPKKQRQPSGKRRHPHTLVADAVTQACVHHHAVFPRGQAWRRRPAAAAPLGVVVALRLLVVPEVAFNSVVPGTTGSHHTSFFLLLFLFLSGRLYRCDSLPGAYLLVNFPSKLPL